MMKLFARLGLAMALTLAANWALAAEVDAISLAGQQRTLSQRIVKAWCQVGLKVQPEISRAQLDAAVRQFDDNLKALEGQQSAGETTSVPARKAVAALRAAWAPLRAAAVGPVRQADAAQLDARAEEVWKAAERLANLLQDETEMPVTRSIHLVEQLRMLSQRLVKIYMLQQWRIDNAAQRDQAARVQKEFVEVLARMQQRVHNVALRAELDSIGLQWDWLHTVLLTEGAESFRLIMAEGGEAVLQLTDQVTRMYQQPAP
jgi:DNA primase